MYTLPNTHYMFYHVPDVTLFQSYMSSSLVGATTPRLHGYIKQDNYYDWIR